MKNTGLLKGREGKQHRKRSVYICYLIAPPSSARLVQRPQCLSRAGLPVGAEARHTVWSSQLGSAVLPELPPHAATSLLRCPLGTLLGALWFFWLLCSSPQRPATPPGRALAALQAPVVMAVLFVGFPSAPGQGRWLVGLTDGWERWRAVPHPLRCRSGLSHPRIPPGQERGALFCCCVFNPSSAHPHPLPPQTHKTPGQQLLGRRVF